MDGVLDDRCQISLKVLLDPADTVLKVFVLAGGFGHEIVQCALTCYVSI